MTKLRPYPEYRDSGFEWLGNIPVSWELSKFRYVFRESAEVNGANIVGEMLSVSGYRGVERKIYDDENQRRDAGQLETYRVLRKGQLAVNTMWLNYSGLGISDFEGHMSPAYRAYWVKRDANLRYMHHLMRSQTFVDAYTSFLAGIRPNSLQMSRANLMDFPVILPPKREQDVIAAFLDRETTEIDNLIGKQERLIELLAEKRQAIITKAITKGLDPSAPTKPSGIFWMGEVPSDWDISRAKHVSTLFVPQRDKPELNRDGGYPWITPINLGQPHPVNVDTFVTAAAALSSQSRTLPKGSVMATCVGRFGLASICREDVVINQQIHGLVPNNKIRADFLRHAVSVATPHFESIATATTIPYVNGAGFENMPLPLPSLAAQDSILQVIDSRTSRIDRLVADSRRVIALLTERRSALISAAVTGKIDLRAEGTAN